MCHTLLALFCQLFCSEWPYKGPPKDYQWGNIYKYLQAFVNKSKSLVIHSLLTLCNPSLYMPLLYTVIVHVCKHCFFIEILQPTKTKYPCIQNPIKTGRGDKVNWGYAHHVG